MRMLMESEKLDAEESFGRFIQCCAKIDWFDKRAAVVKNKRIVFQSFRTALYHMLPPPSVIVWSLMVCAAQQQRAAHSGLAN